MKGSNKYDYRVENLRAFAILVVVLGHSIIIYSQGWDLYTSNKSSLIFQYLKDCINLFQMPLFFSLSGFLFLKTINLESVWKYIIKKTKRLLVPFVLFGIGYMIPLKMVLNYPIYNRVSFAGAVFMLLSGEEMGHLWFLPTLYLSFISSFFIAKLASRFYALNNKYLWLIVFGGAIILSLFKWSNAPFAVYLSYYFNYYWGFALGIVLSCLGDKKSGRLTALCIAFLAVTFAILSIITRGKLPSSIAAISILFLCYSFVPHEKNMTLGKIANNSFGIYLFHSPLIYITFSFFPDLSPVTMLFFNFFIFGALSYYATEFARRTPLRYFIG